MPPRPLPDLPGVYYSIITGAAEGHPSNNTFAFEVTPPPATGAADVAAATAVANAIHTRWPTFCTGSMSQAYTASQVKTYPLHTPSAPAVVVPMTATGGRFGAIEAIMVAAVVKHNVVRRGKGSQSRSSFSPIVTTDRNAAGTQIVGAYQTSLTADFIAFINGVEADVAAAVGGSCLYVQMSKGTVHAAPAAYTISASAAELPLSTQRRRAQR